MSKRMGQNLPWPGCAPLGEQGWGTSSLSSRFLNHDGMGLPRLTVGSQGSSRAGTRFLPGPPTVLAWKSQFFLTECIHEWPPVFFPCPGDPRAVPGKWGTPRGPSEAPPPCPGGEENLASSSSSLKEL